MEQGSADKKPIKVAIIGVGNCASSLVQGVTYYKDAPDDQRVPGLMHVNLGGYHVRDIQFTAASTSSSPNGKRARRFRQSIALQAARRWPCPKSSSTW